MLRLALVFGIVFLGLGASFYSRFAALLLYLWFAFFRPQEWMWVDISSLRLSLVIAAMLVIPSLATGIWPDLRHSLSRAMLAIVACAFVAEITTPNPRDSWAWLQQISQMLLVNLLLVRLVDTPDRLRMTAAVVAGSIGVHAAKQGLVALMRPGMRIAEGIGGAFGDNNSYAVVCAMLSVLLLGLGRTGWSRKSVAMGFNVAGALCIVTCVSTFSRGGFLAVVAGLTVFSLAGGLRIRYLLGAGALAGALYLAMPVPAGYTERLGTIRTYQEDESASSRLHFWRVALDMSLANPLGVGIQNFNSVYNRYDFSGGRYGLNRSVHNSHLQILTEAGMLGFAAWLFLLFGSLATLRRVRKRAIAAGGPNVQLYVGLSDGLVAAICAYIVGGTFTAVGWSDFLWCTIAVTAALDVVSRSEVPAVVPAVDPLRRAERVAFQKPSAAVGSPQGVRPNWSDQGLRRVARTGVGAIRRR
jgi:probable O-glycosylation ligase (exosortase A-associated)